MRIKRRWICPNCGQMYYIRPKSQDELAIIESVMVMKFALRTCARCCYVMTIRPREEDHGQSESQERRPGK